jgi:hypothetical protein
MIYELRIYTAYPDKLVPLMARFRDHTLELFEKHRMTNIAYWRNSIGGRSDEMWYVLGFEDMAQGSAAWAAFGADTDWQQVREESERDGPLVHHIENRILAPTDFSPLQ